MGFYFCGQYINTDDDDKEVERDIFTVVPHFWVIIIVLGMSGKISLRNSSVIFF